MKSQFYGMRIPLIIVGLLLTAVGSILLLPMLGITILPVVVAPEAMPETLFGFSTTLVLGGLTGIGALLLILALINPNMMFG